MRIVIASTYTPFLRGGDTVIVDSLEAALRSRGFEVDTVLIPFRSYWPQIAEQTLGIRCLDLTEAGGERVDLLITVRYPAYALAHPNKVAWFIHHHRGAYDLWGTEYQDLPNTAEGNRVRAAMIRSDTRYLREARRIFTNSWTTAGRLRQFNGIEPDGVLYPPLPNPTLFQPGETGNYFVYTARLTPTKRQDLAIRAMQYVRGDFSLKLIGAADTSAYREALEQLACELKVNDRVELLGWLDEADKAALTNAACACLYVPFDEDSYGYSTLEALHAHKPVITTTDSGGSLELVEDHANGLVCEPDPRTLASAMDELWSNKKLTIGLGERAYQTLAVHNISWDATIASLVG